MYKDSFTHHCDNKIGQLSPFQLEAASLQGQRYTGEVTVLGIWL